MSTVVRSSDGLGGRAARGGVIAISGQLARSMVNAGAIIVLARLLDPSAFGYVAMVVAVTGFGEVLREVGLSKAAVQAARLTTGQRDNLFWMSTGMGVLLSVAIFVAAPLVASFYEQPVLEEITRWIAVTFVLNGLGAQARASIQRDLRFATNAVIDIAGPALGLCVAVAMALHGASYWALVGQQLTIAVVVNVGLLLVAGWVPGFPRRGERMRELVGYGANLLGAQSLWYVSSNIDTILVGSRLGPAAAGMYNRVFQLMKLPITQLNNPAMRVALPVLSRLQEDKQRYREFLVRGQSVLLHLVIPVLALAGALAGPVIEIVLGPAWIPAVSTFTVLALAGLFQAAGFVANWIFMSTGRTRAQLQFALVTRPLMIVAVIVGSAWGMVGIAVGYAVSMIVFWPLSLWWAGRVSGIGVAVLFGNALRAIIGHLVPAVVAAAVVRLIAPASPLHALGIGILVMFLGLLLEVLCWRKLRIDLRNVLRVRHLLRRRPGRREARDWVRKTNSRGRYAE
ncbi:lipopolysaccharide biosynthesis protein [Myceligenerans salitolerans]|uniref:Lipopolysaccharide biosynthesis protein n=1 Tax=Myceligenerans salitolerans TaxID=1230528 RepID=A0ABS3ID12_9MICO|nr:lipopolysaccharide biosynthesis protein [Myceligenerans salitolerans]MBO0610924.1 lipopolysaccharide biosynthesis protein [Myceligenerans salitolerans]